MKDVINKFGMLLFDAMKLRENSMWFDDKETISSDNNLTGIAISATNGNVRIVHSKSSDITLKIKYSSQERINRPFIFVKRDRTIEIVVDNNVVESIVELSIPQNLDKISCNVYIENGNFEAYDVGILEIGVYSKNGNIYLNKVTASKTMLEAISGNVSVQESFTGQTKVNVKLGNIEYSNNEIKLNQKIFFSLVTGTTVVSTPLCSFSKEKILVNARTELGIVDCNVKNRINNNSICSNDEICVLNVYSKQGNIDINI